LPKTEPSVESGPAAEWLPAAIPSHAADLEGAGHSAWSAALLARRGIVDQTAALRFLAPSLDQLHDPFLLAGMEEAVVRLLAARERGDGVAIVGDYDVDGITATALLYAVLRSCGWRAEPILPHRMREGYGFQPVHVERAQSLNCRLILTADCGSSALEAVEAALAAGFDVIVTDHHRPGCELPSKALQINPRQVHCRYPYPDLAAAGLALKLVQAIAQRCGKELELAPLLRIACLGTIADLVPLTGENRVIASLGLSALASVRSLGLRALISQAGLKPPFSAADVGFRLGPRINAAGRLQDPQRALDLLLSRDANQAAALAAELETLNRDRQAEEAKVVDEALEMVQQRSPLPPILVLFHPEWHRGVVGIAASRLARTFLRPTLLLAAAGDESELATGSGRSIPGIDLHAFLAPWASRLDRFGGHAQAVGLTVHRDRLDEMRAEWEAAAQGSWSTELFAARHHYELELAPREITLQFLQSLARLEPFGEGNPQPLLRTGPLSAATKPRTFGKGHLSLQARGEDGSLVAMVGFGWAERSAVFAEPFEILGYPELDSFTHEPVIRLLDCRRAEGLSDSPSPKAPA
jgi:single-stranded-DNA-specific exonuclease